MMNLFLVEIILIQGQHTKFHVLIMKMVMHQGFKVLCFSNSQK